MCRPGTRRAGRQHRTQAGEGRRDPGTLEMVAAEKEWPVGSPWVDRGAARSVCVKISDISRTSQGGCVVT